MRLDHIAYRSADRNKTAQFFKDCFGYSIGIEFDLEFDDGSTTKCIAMTPPEERHQLPSEWEILLADKDEGEEADLNFIPYHAPPEIFVSDGPKGSIVGDWVMERGGIGGIHHIAYHVDDVEATMKEWQSKGYAEFYSDEPLQCEETQLIQVFSKPSELTGVVYELINRSQSSQGFCEKNVKGLMESTRHKKK